MSEPSLPKATPIECSAWPDLLRELASFPAEPIHDDEDGEPTADTWVFRGHASSEWELQPSAERERQSNSDQEDSPHLETFKSKAHLYLPGIRLTRDDDDSTWLSLMQHLGIPTRLLDFTYSQYVAAYFAVREANRLTDESEFSEIIALNWTVLGEALDNIYWRFPSVPRRPPMVPRPVLQPQDYASKPKTWTTIRRMEASARESAREDQQHIRNEGYVFPFLPPIESMRLSQQQGLFLVNGDYSRSFEKSLAKMASRASREWLRRIRIPHTIRDEVRRQLFRMNLHELTLFPDGEGLSRFLVQRLKLFGQ